LFAIRGVSIRQDERIFGVNLWDITPTILALFGLPIPDDLKGGAIVEAFHEPSTLLRTFCEESHFQPEIHSAVSDQSATDATLRELSKRGSIPIFDQNDEALSRLIERDRERNLARVFISQDQAADAAAILNRLVEEDAGDTSSMLYLALCRFTEGNLEECRRLAEILVSSPEPVPLGHYFLGLISAAERKYQEGLTHLLQVQQNLPGLPGLHSELGKLFLQLQNWDYAEAAFRHELAENAGTAEACHGLAVASLQQGHPDRAATFAFEAIGRRYDFPEAHYHLGVALLRLGRPLRAAQAFEACLKLDSNFEAARNLLDSTSNR
jgi:tetratricopeptide (TPR) repeat protein